MHRNGNFPQTTTVSRTLVVVSGIHSNKGNLWQDSVIVQYDPDLSHVFFKKRDDFFVADHGSGLDFLPFSLIPYKYFKSLYSLTVPDLFF